MEINPVCIKPATKEGTKIILNQMSDCICRIENGIGFFCRINKNNIQIKALITSYLILNENYFNYNNKLKIYLGDDNELKIINIDNNRIIHYNQLYNTTIIELKEEDNLNNINNYLELDYNIFNNDINSLYENESIYILDYLNDGKSIVSYGIINNINEYNINNIYYINNNKLIGISNIINYNNKSIILKYPLEEFINKYEITMNNIFNNNIPQIQNMIINNEQIPNIINDNEGFKKKEIEKIYDDENLYLKCPKINVIFKATQGTIWNLTVNHGTTIDELLEKYFRSIGRPDLYEFKIKNFIFLCNAALLKFGDQTKVELFFKNAHIPTIHVNECNNWIYGPIKEVIFKTTLGIIHQLKIDFSMEIKELLKYYLHLVKRSELLTDKNNKICFLYNAKKIKLDDKTILDIFFNKDLNPIIVVNDPQGLISNDK